MRTCTSEKTLQKGWCIIKPKIAILAGSRSDSELGDEAKKTAEKLSLETISDFISAHRQPQKLEEFIKQREEDVECYIAIAGMAAHLPGVIASKTIKPVIGVPAEGLAGGLDSLLSIVQMPRGIPGATVAVKGAANAAILAAEIISLKYPETKQALGKLRKEFSEG